MPIYEYECDAGHRAEQIARWARRVRVCGVDGCQKQARRVVSVAVGVFKGTGFDKGNTNERRVRWN